MAVQYTVTLEDWEDAELDRVSAAAGKTKAEIVEQFALAPLRAQIRTWRHEYAQDMSGLTGEQKMELMNRYIQAKEQYLGEIGG